MENRHSDEVMVRTPGGRYGVVVASGALARLGGELERLAPGRPLMLITDTNVWRRWGGPMLRSLKPRPCFVIRIPPGEEQKRIATVESICERLVAQRADRTSFLVGFGGGVVGDIAGFVAAVFLRGVDYIHVPTTLLAQIDSSVGGKTGVNLRVGKNLVGSFYQPKRVIADPEVLRTLPARELNAGLYEAVKYGILRKPLFQFLEAKLTALQERDPEALTALVRQSVEVKAWVVARDERESGLRRILNLGHTVAHVLEAETGYRYFLHGEAVGWGLRAAAILAEELGILPATEARRIHRLVQSVGVLPPLVRIPRSRLARRLLADKKTRGGTVHFVLPERLGKVRVVTGIGVEAVERALARLRRESSHTLTRERRVTPRRNPGAAASQSAVQRGRR